MSSICLIIIVGVSFLAPGSPEKKGSYEVVKVHFRADDYPEWLVQPEERSRPNLSEKALQQWEEELGRQWQELESYRMAMIKDTLTKLFAELEEGDKRVEEDARLAKEAQVKRAQTWATIGAILQGVSAGLQSYQAGKMGGGAVVPNMQGFGVGSNQATGGSTSTVNAPPVSVQGSGGKPSTSSAPADTYFNSSCLDCTKPACRSLPTCICQRNPSDPVCALRKTPAYGTGGYRTVQ